MPSPLHAYFMYVWSNKNCSYYYGPTVSHNSFPPLFPTASLHIYLQTQPPRLGPDRLPGKNPVTKRRAAGSLVPLRRARTAPHNKSLRSPGIETWTALGAWRRPPAFRKSGKSHSRAQLLSFSPHGSPCLSGNTRTPARTAAGFIQYR